MTLIVHVENVKNFETYCFVEVDGVKQHRPLTQVISMCTVITGLGEITETNYVEFYARVHFVETLTGPFLLYEDREEYVSLEDVKRHIGLRANVSPETRNAFVKRHVAGFFSDLINKVKEEEKNEQPNR